MRVFITGGAGFLGINLVRRLLKKNCDVVSYDLADFDYSEKDSPRVTAIKGDIRDFARLKNAMSQARVARAGAPASAQGAEHSRGESERQDPREISDIIVHCAAALPLYAKQEIFSTDIKGTKNVLQAALELGIRRVVHISSTAVYGIPDHHPLREDDKLDGVGPYGQAKIEAEKVCEEYRRKGLIVPILRPKSFIGPERLGVFALFYDWAKDGHGFPMIGSGHNRYQLLDVEDLCEATWLVMTKDEKTVNDVFNIGAKEFTTMKEDYQAVLDVAGHGKKIKGFPAAPMIWTLRLLEFFQLSPLYKWVYETASKDSFVSIDKAERVLGFSPRYSNKDALIRNYQWYLSHLEQFKDASGISHRVPWKQGILKFFKRFF